MRKLSLSILTTTLLILLIIAFSACSGSKSPIEPTIKNSNSPALPDSSVVQPGNRDVIAVYDATIDPDAGTFTITPAVREGAFHFPLTQLYPNVLKITGYGFTPNFWADIKLKHPLPGSGIKGYDPRVIAILPANAGVRFLYPTLGVAGNNAVVLEPDGYTKLFDNLGGSIPGNVNPFKAYFKDVFYRIWSDTGITEDTQRWNMNLAGFGGPLTYKLVVDVSTNYPNPPQNITDNAKEPVEIKGYINPGGLTSDGGSTNMTMTILDWHQQYALGGIKFEVPDLFDGTENFYFVDEVGPYEYAYVGTISNTKHAPAGQYGMLVAAWENTENIYIYDEFTVTVEPGPPSGNLIWAKSAGGSTGGDNGYSITTLSDNSTVVAGRIQGTATFGKGETNQTVLISAGGYDIFVARYNPDGTLAWAKSAGGTGYDEGFGVTAYPDDSVAITGYFSGTAIFNKGEPSQAELISDGTYDIFIARYYTNGVLGWARRAGGSTDDAGRSVTALSDYSAVVAGAYTGTATFGKYETNETTLIAGGNSDIFIARYDLNGSLLWAKRAGGTSSEEGRGITALSDDSTVVTGYYSGSLVTFGPGEANETSYGTAGNLDIFVAQYNPNGTLAWAKRAGGTTGDYAKGITAISDNSTIVTGYFTGTATFGLSESNQTTLTAFSSYDIFIAHYNSDGTLAWVKQAGGTGKDEGLSVAALSDDSAVLTGYFSDTAKFAPGETNETTLVTFGGMDIYVARYNTDGTLGWVKYAGGIGGDTSFGITALSDDSSIATGNYLTSATFGTGETNQTILTSAGSYDIFVARFKP